MKYLVTGTSIRTPQAQPGKETRTFARLYVVKSKTMQPGINGLEASSIECDPAVATLVEKARAANPLGVQVVDADLDSVTFGQNARVSIVAAEILDLVPRFSTTGLEFVPRPAPRTAPAAA